MRRVLCACLVLFAALQAERALAGEVNVYSYRQEFLMRPFIDAFTKTTGIKVNIVFAKTGMLERLKAEGRNSPADLVLTEDVSRLDALVNADLVQPVTSPALLANIPLQYRHPRGLWFGLTTRARIIYYAKERVRAEEIRRYEDLAEPRWKGRVCMRTAKHVYNRALLASMIAAHGEDGALQWAKGLKGNLARKPQGSDRAQVKAIKEGICDVAIGNHYYYGKMKFNDDKPEQKEWAAAVGLVFPNQGDRGTHVNISGVAMTKSSKNHGEAIKLMEFLSSVAVQDMYARINYEYPVNPLAAWDPEVASWGRYRADTESLQTIADLSPKAVALSNAAGLD